MASIISKKRKKGFSWYIAYRIPSTDGKSLQKWLPCKSKSEAESLLGAVKAAEEKGEEYSKSAVAPKAYSQEIQINGAMTVAELVEKYISKSAKDWDGSTIYNIRHISDDYIKTFIGNIPVKDITPILIQLYYDDLPNHPAKQIKGRKTPAGNISARTVREVHKILRPAMNLAVLWGILQYNPTVPVGLPKEKKYMRKTWNDSELMYAIDICDDELLKLCICLAFACSLRPGELAGLTWSATSLTDEHGTPLEKPSIEINKIITREYISALKETNYRGIIMQFPPIFGKPDSKTVMVMKNPKTETSTRRVYLPLTVARMLLAYKAKQNNEKEILGDDYNDYDLVVAQNNGNPYDVKDISKRFNKFIAKNKLSPVQFMSLRHSSVTTKLRATAGDIKSVQGDTGHSSPEMINTVYAQIRDENRAQTAEIMDDLIFSKLNNDNIPDSQQ